MAIAGSATLRDAEYRPQATPPACSRRDGQPSRQGLGFGAAATVLRRAMPLPDLDFIRPAP
jgi:hypothetical protein